MRATKWAFRVALALSVLGILIVLVNPVAGLLMAAVYASFAWGLKRQQAWAAVAWLVFLVLPIPFAMRLSGIPAWQMASSAALQLGEGVLVLLAARELWRDTASSRTAWPWAAGMLGFLLCLVCLHPYTLPTRSMEPTLLQGDYFLMQSRLWGVPQRDEIVAYKNPSDPKEVWVKRVTGIPGDRLRIVNKQLYRNGVAVPEPYAVHETSYVDSFRDNFPSAPAIQLQPGGVDMLANHVRNGEVVVPPGEYFVLGDNRDDSLDSRYRGFVPAANIVGHPWLIYASYAPMEHSTERTLFNTRWNRLFKVI